jgi:hypothetical protein
MLGRVLAAAEGAREACGWIGPCPVPQGRNGPVSDGWYSAAQLDTTFPRLDRIPGPPGVGQSGLQSPSAVKDSVEQPMQTTTDPVWLSPPPPSRSSTTVQLSAVRFVPQRLDPPMTPGDDRDNAIVEVKINNKLVVYRTAYYPSFVAAPRCIDGPHVVEASNQPSLGHIIDVADLEGFSHTDSRVLIINATGRGDCELAARAWCCEKNHHAVVVRSGEGTCFVCAVRLASDRGVGTGCLIWT